jgi:hypothetical protein
MFMDFNIENFMEKALGQASIMVSSYFDWHFCTLAIWSLKDEEFWLRLQPETALLSPISTNKGH